MQSTDFSEYNTSSIQDVSLGAIYSTTFLESERRVHRNSRFEKLYEGLLIVVFASSPIGMHATPETRAIDDSIAGVEVTFSERPSYVPIELDNSKTRVAIYPNYIQSEEYKRQALKEANAHKALVRELALRSNFMRNKPAMFPEEYIGAMQRYSKMLSALDFKDCIVQYNIEDEVLEYSMYFNNGVKLALSIYADESDNMSDFCIFQDHELLVADTLPVWTLISKMEKILKKLKDNA